MRSPARLILYRKPEESISGNMSPSIDALNWCATNEAIELSPDEALRTNQTKSASKSLVLVRNGVKGYGNKPVLKNLNLNVEKGTIYALLGASGCGKTTLLACIVGTKVLNSGQIYYNGESMDVIKAQGGLRQRVGYMPQELALYKEFTIKESLLYFGRIFGLSNHFIAQQTDFLVKFLQLPTENTLVGKMSGGQQRRASFAVALLHAPEFLILDEPTVGVDPILRKSIWEFLRKLVNAGNTTVIITTHYIEEAKDADAVGMMRNGRILAEGAPGPLLATNNCSNLEELFLTLSMQDDSNEPTLKYNHNVITGNDGGITTEMEAPISNSNLENLKKNKSLISQMLCNPFCGFDFPSYRSRLNALINKNLIFTYRQLTYIFALLLFPAIELLLCCWAVGGNPWGLSFGIVNHELKQYHLDNELTNETFSCDVLAKDKTCDDMLTSCDFVQEMEKSDTFKVKYFESEGEALDEVKSGYIWGFISIPHNFTRLSVEKALAGLYADQNTVSNSRIDLQLDMTNFYASATMRGALYEIAGSLMKNRLIECEPSFIAEIVDGPIRFEGPIYGKLNQALTDYMSTGVLLMVMFFAAISVTAMSYVLEKKQGMLERTIVAGVSTTEIITAQFLTQYIIIFLQTLLCVGAMFGVFKIEINEQLGFIMLMILLQGSIGMLAGFVLSSICDEETVVMQLSTALTIPCMILGGTIWPLEAMPKLVQYFSLVFVPQTIANKSLRSMVLRNWGITHPQVWPGFVVTIVWIIVLWTISIIFAKRSVSPKN